MNNAAFFFNTFERTKSKKNPTARKQLNPRRLQNHHMLPEQDKTPKEKERREMATLFQPPKTLLRASIIFQKESYLVVHQHSILNSANPFSRIPFSLSDQCILFYCFFSSHVISFRSDLQSLKKGEGMHFFDTNSPLHISILLFHTVKT